MSQPFIDECKPRLARIHTGLTAWRAGRVDAALLVALRDEFRELQQGADAAGYAEAAALGDSVSRLLAQSDVPRGIHDVGLLNLLEEAHDGLAADLGLAPALARGHIKSLNSMVALLLSDGAHWHASPGNGAAAMPMSQPAPEPAPPSARSGTFAEPLQHLRHLARETAERANKLLEFSLHGGDVEIERSVVERLLPALERLIHNSIAQRIEDPGARAIAGKPAAGSIRLTAARQGGEVLLEYADDGRGLDARRFADAALALGLCARASDVRAMHWLQILTRTHRAAAAPGAGGNGAAAAFNLAGMDDILMMHQAVGELDGLLALQTAQSPAAGLRLQCLIPRAVTSPRALMVTAGGYRLALPMRQVDCILRARASESGADGRKTIRLDDARRIPLTDLAAALSAPNSRQLPPGAPLPHRPPAEPPAPRPLVLLRMTERIAAFAVDQIHDIIEITHRAPGVQLAGIRGLQGIAVPTEAGGGIAPMFDPAAFIEQSALQDDGLVRFPLGAPGATDPPAPVRVLALETPRGAMLIPLNLIADIVNLPVSSPASPQPGDFARHDEAGKDFTRSNFTGDDSAQGDAPRRSLIRRNFDWRGLQVPLLDASAAVGAPTSPLSRGARAVVLRPLQGSRATAFFALAGNGPPALLEVAVHAPAVTPREPPDNALGCVQLQHRIGIIPDLRRLAREIFTGGAAMRPAAMQ